MSQVDWELTPRPIRITLINQHHQLEALQRRLDELEGKYKANSQNSDKPPSTDSPLTVVSQPDLSVKLLSYSPLPIGLLSNKKYWI